MTKKSTRLIFPLLAVSLLIFWSVACTQSSNSDITGPDVAQIAPAAPSVAANTTNASEASADDSYPVAETGNYVESKTDKESPFQLYVTPDDPAIGALATQINGAQDAYEVAVQWLYVSEQTLNQAADKWLTPRQFLVDTPYYPGNPVQDEEASDCEEQAHTLVSLIRAEGIPPEEVRVVLGEVDFGDGDTGHAWVELLTNDQWLALEADSGPYWDDKAGKLVHRQGLPFYYYAGHAYPVVQVWVYYNDIYYWDTRDSSGNAPAWWAKATP